MGVMLMSEKDEIGNELSVYDEFGEAFNQDEDKLRVFDEKFKQIDQDPLELYKQVRIQNSNITDKRIKLKIGIVDRWQRHMSQYDRHVACPSTKHAGMFIDQLIAEDLSQNYTKRILRVISNMFDYWAKHPNMPHGTGAAEGYNPIDAAVMFKEENINDICDKKKSVPRITIEELGHRLRGVKNLLHRSVITTQFKYGLRASQICNLQLSEVKINHEELNELYPALGTHQRIRDLDDDVIYFASRDETPGVKSARPTVMPMDRETRRLLVKYLRQRPPVDLPWLFINNATGNQLRTEYINESMWKPVFHPEYSETEEFRPVTSHYGRHRFTTYWKKEIDINRELLKYMRGDKQSEQNESNSDALDMYVHTYYEDIKDRFLSDIYTFNL
jgi:integrase/recombinase XerD